MIQCPVILFLLVVCLLCCVWTGLFPNLKMFIFYFFLNFLQYFPHAHKCCSILGLHISDVLLTFYKLLCKAAFRQQARAMEI